MSGNKHVVGAPVNRMRELARPGTWRGLLERHARENAAIRMATMHSAMGKLFRYATNPGSDRPYIVADQTGGRTFAPGTEVMLGKPYEAKFEAVLGGPPAGKKGPTRGRRPGRRPAPLVANQYAFVEDPDDGYRLHALLYQEGTYVSRRASIPYTSHFLASSGAATVSPILVDSSGLVGDGSIILNSDPEGDFAVWDVEGEVIYTYAEPANWLRSKVQYQGGFLWWIETTEAEWLAVSTGITPSTYQARLRKATTDLTTVVTVSTWTAPAVTFPSTYYKIPNDSPLRRNPALTTDAAVVVVHWRANLNNAPDQPSASRLSFPLDGSAIVEESLGSAVAGLEYPDTLLPDAISMATGGGPWGAGIGAANGSLIPLGGNYNNGSHMFGPVSLQGSDPSAAAVDFWPLTMVPEPPNAGINTLGVAPLLVWNLSPGGGLLQVRAGVIDDATVYVRDSALTAPAGPTAAVSFAVTAVPDLPSANMPILFYFGED